MSIEMLSLGYIFETKKKDTKGRSKNQKGI